MTKDTKDEPTTQKAVVYCRVSGAKQVTEGDGLASQETRCREFAKYKNYTVVNVFADDISGKAIDRPAMSEMLLFLRKNKRSGPHIVIIDDISRFARDLRSHLELRSTLANAGGILESPSIEFGEDSDSILVENLLASVAQHQREKNGEQTMNRMRARVMNGYWVFYPPLGYRYEKVKGHGKLLVRDEPTASIIKEAFEGFASGRLESMTEVKRHLESHPEISRNKRGEVHLTRVAELFDRRVYAGFIDIENWGLDMIPAKHEPLISLETFMKVQTRRQGNAKAPARKDINADFPLRGFAACSDCNNPFTACWSTGKQKKYPYYLCDTKGCESYRKSIPRDKMESEFEGILRALNPSETLFDLAKAMFKSAWNQRLAQSESIKKQLQLDIRKVEKKTETLLDRIVETNTDSVVAAYEARIANLEQEKRLMAEKLTNQTGPLAPFDKLFEHAMKFLSSPWKIWQSGDLLQKRTVLRLAFRERLTYSRENGYRTPNLSLPFKLLGGFNMENLAMVRAGGLEPPRPTASGF